MKKNINIFFIAIVGYFFMISNIFGYDLKFSSNVDEKGFLVFTTVVKASQNSIDNFGNREYGQYIRVSNDNFGNKYASYDIVRLVLHKEKLSNYEPTTQNLVEYKTGTSTYGGYTVQYNYTDWMTQDNYNVLYYDKFNEKIDSKNISSYLSFNGKDKIKVVSDSSEFLQKNYEEVEIGPNTTAASMEYTLINSAGQICVQYRYKIAYDYFEKKIREKNLVQTDEKGRRYVYISFATQKQGTGVMYTAYQFYSNIFGSKSSAANDMQEYMQLEKIIDALQKDKVELEKSIATLRAEHEQRKNSGANSMELDAIMAQIRTKEESLEYNSASLEEKTNTLNEIQSRLGNINGCVFAPYTKGCDYGGVYGRGWAAVNDYDNKLYLPDDGEKPVYVNYLEEYEDKELSVIKDVVWKGENISKKLKSDPHQIRIKDVSEWKDLTRGSRYDEYFVDNNSDENEEYKLPTNEVDSFKAVYMKESELNEKLAVIEDEYKYKYVKVLGISEAGKSYEELRDKILNKEHQTESKKTYQEVALKLSNGDKNSKPALVSFVYKSSRKNLKVFVQHVVEKGKKILPIARHGNMVTNAVKDSATTDNLALWKVDAKVQEAEVSNTLPTYVDDEAVKYNFIPKISVFKCDANGNEIGRSLYTDSIESYSFNPSDVIKDYRYIKVIFYYETTDKDDDDEPIQFEDEMPDICIKLSFEAAMSGGYSYCTDESKCKQNEICVEQGDFIAPNRVTIVPTSSDYTGNVNTLKYYIDEEYGIKQEVSLTEEEGEIILDWVDNIYEASQVQCDPVESCVESDPDTGNCLRKKTEYPKATVYTQTDEKSMDEKAKEEAERHMNIIKSLEGKTLPIFNVDMIFGISEPKWEYDYVYSGCSGTKLVDSKKYVFRYKYYVATVKIVGLKSYYLTISDLQNHPETVFESDGDSPISAVSKVDTRKEFEDKFKNEMLAKIKKAYEVNNSDLRCMNLAAKEGEEQPSWLSGYSQVYETDIIACSDQPLSLKKEAYFPDVSTHVYLKIYDTWKYGLKEIIKEAKYTIPYEFLSKDSTYNGERLSIAKLVYANYYIKYNPEGKERYPGMENTFKPSGVISEIEDATKYAEKESNTSGINILNPAQLTDPIVEASEKIVSHTLGNNNSFNLQVGAEATVIPRLSAQDPVYTRMGYGDRKSYIAGYAYMFNFPVKVSAEIARINVSSIGENSACNDNGECQQGKWIWVPRQKSSGSVLGDLSNLQEDRAGSLTFTPIGLNSARGDYDTSQVKIDTDTITVVAMTKNVPNLEGIDDLNNDSPMNVDPEFGISGVRCSNEDDRTNNIWSGALYGANKQIRNDGNYFSSKASVSTSNISRLYGFRITDCTDVNFKNVFRKQTSNTVNEHTGTVYFSGIRELDVYTNTYKSGKTPTIPLGPYSQSAYVEAPKMGYRISFDLKTSGYYTIGSTSQKRTIVIFPKLYYISKDGKTYIDNVTAYYKGSNGKYVKIDQATNLFDANTYINAVSNGGNSYNSYKITYVPNDGYRNVLDRGITDKDIAFTKNQKTLNMSAIVLTEEMMCTNDDGFLQTWYGEYKLPNSTILVRTGETNLNNHLRDGYCGVVFYIGVVEQSGGRNTIVMSYHASDKLSASTNNTSQWDYEGFLGFPQSNCGRQLNATLSIKLARGVWKITDDSLYQNIKGTVLLYDLDNRAANDFD